MSFTSRLRDNDSDDKSDDGEDYAEFVKQKMMQQNRGVTDNTSTESDDSDSCVEDVCLKNISRNLNEAGIRNICAQFGEIKSFRRMQKSPYYVFVTYATKKQSKIAFNGINLNNFNMRAEMSTRKYRRRNEHRNDHAMVMDILDPKKSSSNVSVSSSLRTTNDEFDEDDFRINNRNLIWPYSGPTKFIATPAELITDDDYKQSPKLNDADITKQFLFPTYIQNILICENAERMIIDGRVCFKDTFAPKETKLGVTANKEYSFNSGANNLMLLKLCENCNTIANKFCNDCDSPFCSVECVTENVDHLERCKNRNGKIYEIKQPVDKLNGQPIPVEPQPIPNGSEVVITCAITHKVLFIRSIDPECDEEYIGLMNDIAHYALTAPNLSALPEPGDWVLAKWRNIVCRALVLKVTSDNKVVCGFIDFGNVAKCSLVDLKFISDKLKRRPWTVIKIILNGATDVCIYDDALKMIAQKILTNETFVLSKMGAANNVDLINPMEQSLVAEINAIHLKFIKVIHNDPKYCEELVFTSMIGSNIKVIITENITLNMGELAAINILECDQFSQNEKEINAVGQIIFKQMNMRSYTPRHDEICLVRPSDGVSKKCYRGQCYEVGDDGHPLIFYLDYGCMKPVKIRNIRPIPSSLMFPVLTKTMFIKGMESTSELQPFEKISMETVVEKQEAFAELLPIGSELVLINAEMVKQEKNDVLVIELPVDLRVKFEEIYYADYSEGVNGTN